MSMDVLNFLNKLEEMIEESPKIPLSGKVLINDDVFLEYLDRIRTMLPDEIRQAKWIAKEKEKVLEDARRDAERIVEEAKNYVSRLANESEVTKHAGEQAEEIIKQAHAQAKEIRQGAAEYADEILHRLELHLDKTLGTVRKGRDELKNIKS